LPLRLQRSSNALAIPLLIACGRFWLSRNLMFQTAQLGGAAGSQLAVTGHAGV
jgi:hypothetical protein